MGFFTKNNDPFGTTSKAILPKNEARASIPVPPPPPVPLVPCVECAKIENVLQNQAVILRNQQLIVDAILTVGKDLRELMIGEPEPEPSPEELREAALALRQQKHNAPAVIQGTIIPEKKKGMPKGGWPKK